MKNKLLAELKVAVTVFSGHDHSICVRRTSDAIRCVSAKAAKLDNSFSSLVKKAVKGDVRQLVPEKDLVSLATQLESLRSIESEFKQAHVAEELADLYLQARTEMAEARSRMATLHIQASQAHTIPTEFQSNIKGEGLKALAEHATKVPLTRSERQGGKPMVPVALQRSRILCHLAEVTRPARMSVMAAVAFPDYTFRSPQGAALAVSRTVRGMEGDGLVRWSGEGAYWGYLITGEGRKYIIKREEK